MKYADLISFSPIESIIQLTEANDREKEANLVHSYVMSDDMADKLKNNMLSQLRLDEVVDNKGVLLVGNYGTGKSHLMSLISAVARDADYLGMVQNRQFAADAACIADQFEVLRIEIGAVQMSLRNIILNRVKQDFAERGLDFSFPDEREIITNKEVLLSMMELFANKYADRGYLIVVDEFLDYLGGRKEQEVKLDLGFMRELGEIIKSSRLRVIFGVQEKLFDNPNFAFVSQTLNRVKDRYEQVIIRKEDTAYVMSERILKKTPEQKAIIREHLQKFCSLYSNMSERMEEYVELFPIHPSYIDVFNKIYIIENRHILKNISEIIRRNLDTVLADDVPGIISFDSYWAFIKENLALKTDPNIKEVVEKSGMLEDIVTRAFPKKLYKSLALQIINALSVHRLTTGDISIRAGLTSENLRDDLCLYLKGMPDQSSDTLQSVIQITLKDIMTTVSGQFIEHNTENGQYYGNASSQYSLGVKARQAIKSARDQVAVTIGAEPAEITFTSGGTEGNNWVLQKVPALCSGKPIHIITSAIEHPSILNTCSMLEKRGVSITYLPVDGNGCVAATDVQAAIRADTKLVSIMTANNEIGSVQPISEIGWLLRERGIFFHTDAVQAVGHIPVNVKELNVDFLTASAHKFNGAKGTGFLYSRSGCVCQSETEPVAHLKVSH